MPTITWVKGYRLYFVSFDGSEPMHVHIRKENKNAKIWISSLSLAWSDFTARENRARVSGAAEAGLPATAAPAEPAKLAGASPADSAGVAEPYCPDAKRPGNNMILGIVEENTDLIREKWYEHFGY